MKHRTGKLLRILLALVMIVGLLPVMSLPVLADDQSNNSVQGYDLWVGGQQVTPTQLSGEGWSYDLASKPL